MAAIVRPAGGLFAERSSTMCLSRAALLLREWLEQTAQPGGLPGHARAVLRQRRTNRELSWSRQRDDHFLRGTVGQRAGKQKCKLLALELKTRRQSTKLLQIAHRSYRFPTRNNVHLRFPDDGTIPPADKPSSSRAVTLPPSYRTPIKDGYMGRQRQVRRRRPSTILPHLFYGTAAPGANGPGKRKWPRR